MVKKQTGSCVFDPFDPQLGNDPYRFYDELRSLESVHQSPFGMWVVTGYDEVVTLLRHPDTSNQPSPQSVHSRADRASSPAKRLSERLFALLDGADHLRLRRVTTKAFKAHFEHADAMIDQSLSKLLSRVLERGTLDIVTDLARPLPVWVICDYLGLPESDRDYVEQYVHDLFYIFSPGLEDDVPRRLNRAILELEAYFREWIDFRKRHPEPGLLSDLIALEEAGEISPSELVANCLLLFSNGAETVAHMIGNAMLSLFEHPAQAARLQQEPELIESAVEEFLRFESPSMIISKNSGPGIRLSGFDIPPQQPVFAVVGAANRDPKVFQDPHQLRLDRTPNKHLAFSSGRHSCLGAALARAQARLAIPRLLALPGLAPDGDHRWKESITLRGLATLPARFEPLSKESGYAL